MKKMLKNELVEMLVKWVEVEGVYFINKYGLSSGVAYDMIVNIKINHTPHKLKAHAMSKSWALVGHLRPNLHGNGYKGSNGADYTPEIEAYWLSPTKRALKEYFNRFTKKELKEIIIFSDKALDRIVG